MANIAAKRIKREFKEVMKSEEVAGGSIKLELVNDGWTELKGEIAGPPDTPYEGGTFILEIKVPETYPFNPPKIRFVTKIWHPNVSSVTGAICLDILKDQWAAALTLRTVLLSLQALLSAAEPNDPQMLVYYDTDIGDAADSLKFYTIAFSGTAMDSDYGFSFRQTSLCRGKAHRWRLVFIQRQKDAVVAKQYRESPQLFELTARHWTNVYAGGPCAVWDFNAKVQRLLDMGVDEHQARVALSTYDWELERATEQLFS